jgi:growth factor-regulated tyrosine kinase substrate
MIPAGQEDMALNLDICDRIRSKQVPGKEAMRALKKRIGHKNPNVQLLALKLTDISVKNGGPHFLVEIASREFVDFVVSVSQSSGTNYEVKNKILGLLQSWSFAFKERSDLSYMSDTVNSLKSQGISFPQAEKITPTMIDTIAPPDWTDSDVCERCRTLFTISNRKHHCRNCGKTFCKKCADRYIPLPRLGINQDVRVCESCFYSTLPKSSSKESLPSNNFMNDVERKEDEELQKAIALSLLEKQKGSKSESKAKPSKQLSDESDDDDLRAAIKASLSDVQKKEKEATSASIYPTVLFLN